jgi:hypothetical protein
MEKRTFSASIGALLLTACTAFAAQPAQAKIAPPTTCEFVTDDAAHDRLAYRFHRKSFEIDSHGVLQPIKTDSLHGVFKEVSFEKNDYKTTLTGTEAPAWYWLIETDGTASIRQNDWIIKLRSPMSGKATLVHMIEVDSSVIVGRKDLYPSPIAQGTCEFAYGVLGGSPPELGEGL